MKLKTMTTIFAVTAGMGFAQTTAQPAAKVHVKELRGSYLKYTSKLKQVVELNFTMNYHHTLGKPIISKALDEVGAADGFTVKKFTSGVAGGEATSPGTAKTAPNFTLEDLRSGQVIVANNISSFGSSSIPDARKTAIQTAIETDGIGYLGFHASGDQSGTPWAFLAEKLHPVDYKSHGARVGAPVYKHLPETNHLVLQGVLTDGASIAKLNVPNEVNGSTEVISTEKVNTRNMKNEWYKFARQFVDDPKYKPSVTMLLKYDARAISTGVLEETYKRKGGNVYTWLLKVGNGMTSYMPPGHENDELLTTSKASDNSYSFDGGAGDFKRYLSQVLHFVAGYTTEVCGASNCNGLPMVDSLNRLTGQNYTTTGIIPSEVMKSDLLLEDSKVAFFSPYEDKPYEAKVMDLSGKVLDSKSGKGMVYHEFKSNRFNTGVFILSVKVGNSQPKTKRYAFLPGSR